MLALGLEELAAPWGLTLDAPWGLTLDAPWGLTLKKMLPSPTLGALGNKMWVPAISADFFDLAGHWCGQRAKLCGSLPPIAGHCDVPRRIA
mgnify:CR=1 FL=1